MSYFIESKFQTLASFPSVTNFRSWVGFVINSLTLAGLVETDDTGQLNIDTIALPAPSSYNSGYKIFRFNDELQATAPVFIKFIFGTEASMSDGSRITIDIGTGSDGAGNITGVLVRTFRTVSDKAYVTPNQTHIFSGAANRFVLLLSAYGGSSHLISLERAKNNDGSDSDSGLLLCTMNGLGGFYPENGLLYLPFVGTIPAIEKNSGRTIPLDSMKMHGIVGVVPFYFSYFGFYVNPGLNLFMYNQNDLQMTSVVPVEINGNLHNYMAAGLPDVAGVAGEIPPRLEPKSNANTGLLVRFE